MPKNRKPFLGLKQSLIEFFRAPVRYLKESNVKESQFEKPYLDSEYPKMHFDIPAPDWPNWKFPVPPGGYSPTRNCDHCFLHYFEPSDCTRPIQFFMLRVCTECNLCDCRFEVEALVGAVKEIADGTAGTPVSWDIYVDGSIDTHLIRGKFTDGAGNVCSEDVYVECCSCPSGDFVFDPVSTPDTIAPGGSVTVYVSGGCPPYSWSVSGTGYTLDNAETTVVNNGLNSADGD